MSKIQVEVRFTDELESIRVGGKDMEIPKAIKTKFGQRACTYFMPEEQRNIKMNFSTDEKGLVNTILVTVYGSIDIMYPDLLNDLRLNTNGSMLVKERRSEAEVMNDFNNNP